MQPKTKAKIAASAFTVPLFLVLSLTAPGAVAAWFFACAFMWYLVYREVHRVESPVARKDLEDEEWIGGLNAV